MGLFDNIRKNLKKGKTMEKNEIMRVLESVKRNEIGIYQSESAIAPNASKLGGKPFLPKDFAWPYFEGESYEDGWGNWPLSFICQINLDEVKKYDEEKLLPEKGMLYFFYESASQVWGFDPSDKGAARVFYYENTEGFAALDFPEDLKEEFIIKELRFDFYRGESYPSFEELEIHSDIDCDWEEYDEALEALDMDLEVFLGTKFLGYADIIQSEMLTQCEEISRGIYCGDGNTYAALTEAEKADIKKCAGEWILLAQFNSFDEGDFELMFGDCGKIYYYIKKDDLKNRNFENIWLVLQCG